MPGRALEIGVDYLILDGRGGVPYGASFRLRRVHIANASLI